MMRPKGRAAAKNFAEFLGWRRELGEGGVIERVCLYLGRLWWGDPDSLPV